MAKGGRPRLTGERYPSGDLKPLDAPELAPALWQRIRTAMAERFGDANYGAELGRLNGKGVITEAELTTGLRLGEIYRRYHRLKGLRDTPKSPGYEQGRAGSADLAEERMDAEQLEQFEAAVRTATAAWEFVDGALNEVPLHVRDATEEICVYDRAVNPGLHADIRWSLRMLSRLWSEQRRRRGSAAVNSRANAKQLLRALRTGPAGGALPPTTGEGAPAEAVKPRERRIDTATHAMEAVAKVIRPDLDAQGLREVVEVFTAVRDRQDFRRKKTVATVRSP